MSTSFSLPPSREEVLSQGRAARGRAPRRSLATLSTAPRDPLGIIARQNAARVQDLIPLRTERMSESPFAFFRGTAAIMAADLADAPHSGILLASCGDAHVANFGFYASPQRHLVFDLNDFDEAAWAPWEWDVKRLVTSIVIGGRATARDERVIEAAARTAIRTYLDAIRHGTKASPTRRYFTHFDVASSRKLLDRRSRDAIQGATEHAARRTGERAVRRLTEMGEDGRRRFVVRPPTTLPVTPEISDRVEGLLDEFQRSATQDIALLFEHYAPVDIVRRVVGVGSVGTRCYLVLLQDGDENALVMQAKEASQSVLIEHGRILQPAPLVQLIADHGEGARVVAMQRILQALSDPFLGHLQSPDADFYARQFHDMKGGIDVEELEDHPFQTYARACAAVLARAHGQSPAATRVAGYVGGGRTVTEALLAWSYAYADVSRADYAAFVADGRD